MLDLEEKTAEDAEKKQKETDALITQIQEQNELLTTQKAATQEV